MTESGYYAPGTEFDPNAPWNEPVYEEKEYEVSFQYYLNEKDDELDQNRQDESIMVSWECGIDDYEAAEIAKEAVVKWCNEHKVIPFEDSIEFDYSQDMCYEDAEDDREREYEENNFEEYYNDDDV